LKTRISYFALFTLFLFFCQPAKLYVEPTREESAEYYREFKSALTSFKSLSTFSRSVPLISFSMSPTSSDVL